MHSWILWVGLCLVACGQREPPVSAPSAAAPGVAQPAVGVATLPVDRVLVPIPMGPSEGVLTKVDTLFVDRSPVTVGQFAAFTAETGFRTQAEAYGNSGVFDMESRTWTLADGAFWRKPFGKTGPTASEDHPVTQVNYYDARRFCQAYGMRLPTEAEWEAMARYRQPAGTSLYPWGDDIKDDSEHYRANVWEGIFPHVYRDEDGYTATSPVGAFGVHPSGLTDMAGNVWEWVSDSLPGIAGPGEDMHHLGKGGSFLCEPGWCHGYLITGSTHNSAETGLFHTGFRCVCEKRPFVAPKFAPPNL